MTALRGSTAGEGSHDDAGHFAGRGLVCVHRDARCADVIHRPATSVTLTSRLTRFSTRTRMGGVLLMVTLMAGCVVPAPSDSTYADKAQRSLQAAASQTATVELVVSQVLAGKAFRAFADQVVSE